MPRCCIPLWQNKYKEQLQNELQTILSPSMLGILAFTSLPVYRWGVVLSVRKQDLWFSCQPSLYLIAPFELQIPEERNQQGIMGKPIHFTVSGGLTLLVQAPQKRWLGKAVLHIHSHLRSFMPDYHAKCSLLLLTDHRLSKFSSSSLLITAVSVPVAGCTITLQLRDVGLTQPGAIPESELADANP